MICYEEKMLPGAAEWLIKQSNPPEVILYAYLCWGPAHKWRFIRGMSKTEYEAKSHEEWGQWVKNRYKSAIAIRFYCVEEEK